LGSFDSITVPSGSLTLTSASGSVPMSWNHGPSSGVMPEPTPSTMRKARREDDGLVTGSTGLDRFVGSPSAMRMSTGLRGENQESRTLLTSSTPSAVASSSAMRTWRSAWTSVVTSGPAGSR
jgi:hypothetical protein